MTTTFEEQVLALRNRYAQLKTEAPKARIRNLERPYCLVIAGFDICLRHAWACIDPQKPETSLRHRCPRHATPASTGQATSGVRVNINAHFGYSSPYNE